MTNYFNTNYQLMQNHKYSLTELENMIPWEREVYLTLLINEIEEIQKIKEQNKNRV
jgi:hypothetical protein